VIEAGQMIPALLGFRLDIGNGKIIRNSLAQYLFTTFSSKAAHVGDDVAACLDGGQYIGMNGP
jgi:hypothetical protein